MKGRIFTPEEEALLGKVGVTVTVSSLFHKWTGSPSSRL